MELADRERDEGAVARKVGLEEAAPGRDGGMAQGARPVALGQMGDYQRRRQRRGDEPREPLEAVAPVQRHVAEVPAGGRRAEIAEIADRVLEVARGRGGEQRRTSGARSAIEVGEKDGRRAGVRLAGGSDADRGGKRRPTAGAGHGGREHEEWRSRRP